MRRPDWIPLLAVLALVAPARLDAQDSTGFRSFSAMRPALSAEITIASGMESPEGTYRVRDARDLVREHTFQVSECEPLAPTASLRRDMPGESYARCRVVEISVTPGCDRCEPYAIPFDRVTFARYTSSVRDERGRPVVDNWYAMLGVGSRRMRLLIEESRFVLHDWGVADPNMAIIEAPIRRLRARGTSGR